MKTCFSYKKDGHIKMPEQGSADCAGTKLKLAVTCNTDSAEIRQSINSYNVTDNKASTAGHGYNLCIEDSMVKTTTTYTLTSSGGKTNDDNVRRGSFLATLEKEKLYRMNTVKMTVKQTKSVVFRYVMLYCNRKRISTAEPSDPLTEELCTDEDKVPVNQCGGRLSPEQRGASGICRRDNAGKQRATGQPASDPCQIAAEQKRKILQNACFCLTKNKKPYIVFSK